MVLIRADGNSIIGSGHIMRCLSIAAAISKTGEKATFVLSSFEDCPFYSKILSAGFSCIELNSKYDDLNSELSTLLNLIHEITPRFVLIDSYFVTQEYLASITMVCKTIYMDDLLSFPYDVDCIINYNIFAKEDAYKELYCNKPIPQLIIGPTYVPLREEFKNIRPRKQSDVVRRILVSTGGSDPLHIALRMIEHIINSEWIKQPFEWHFLIGAANVDIIEIESTINAIDTIVLHVNERNIAQLMQSCDIAISAAGSTLYELCACGVPTVTYITADNQLENMRTFEELGVMLAAGDMRNSTIEILFDRVNNLIESFELRIEVASKAKAIVTGNGADTIACSLLGLRHNCNINCE